MTYDIGDLVKLSAQFTDIDGTPADPTVAVIEVRDPLGVNSTPGPIIRTGVGAYYYELPVTMAGLYNYRWTGTGTVQAATEGSILVKTTILVGPSPIDLVTVQQVTQWIPTCTLTDLANIQICITSASQYWLWATGRDDGASDPPTASPLVSPVVFNEWYDGAGGSRQFVRQTPVRSVSSVTVDGVSIPQSTGALSPGWVIDQGKKSLVIRPGSIGQGYRTSRYGVGYAGRFSSGVQNVNIQYIAGFNGTPPDIIEKCIEMVVLNYRRRNWVDMKSNTKPDTMGTVVYRDWELTPGIVAVMENYSRRAIV